ncbi:glycosyltransferase [Actinomyces oricola]|uniref:glycosyltransferase n=1 Tax=Actinomyces oricola TaxID=206043 RepID=UPI000FFEB954|nr:glycosyltransferase [Actinomyces oricola]
MTRIGYVLKVYPRFSETFVVTEILAREAQGETLNIYALRPTTDSRFHPEIARVSAPVRWLPRPLKGCDLWRQLCAGLKDPVLRERFAALMPALATLPGDEVAQGVALAQAVLADGITHIHAHFASLAGRVAWIASRLSGVPFTVTTHAKDIFHESVNMDWLRRLGADAHRVIAISRFNEAYLGRVLAGTGARVSLRYNALELDRFPFRSPLEVSTPLRVLAVGRLVEKKGFEVLLEAVGDLVGRGYRLEVDIAGEGELADRLARRVVELELTGVVRLLGARTQAEVRSLLGRAHLFAAPCLEGGDGNIDGLPTVVLEAMACGTPVVATSVTGLPEVVEDGRTGILLPPGDAVALAGAIARVAGGQVDLAGLARAARALIEERFDSRQQAAVLAAWESPQAGER